MFCKAQSTRSWDCCCCCWCCCCRERKELELEPEEGREKDAWTPASLEKGTDTSASVLDAAWWREEALPLGSEEEGAGLACRDRLPGRAVMATEGDPIIVEDAFRLLEEAMVMVVAAEVEERPLICRAPSLRCDWLCRSSEGAGDCD